MDQTLRNKLRNAVTQCRKVLEDSTSQALQGRFGIYSANNKSEIQVEDESHMVHLAEEDRVYRKDLLIYLEHIKAIGYKPCEALEQLIREIAFTHLNRLCAYKMMEARGLIREAVSRGLRSQYFFFYLADHPEDEKLHNSGQQEAAYRNFFDWLGGTLSEEIGVLFNPNDPANRIYPPQRVLDEVLVLINDGELSGIWSEDETIGWVYQYFTPKELRDKARQESQAPRNSYELAFRNQFYTPRYVVEFLTDNTLGRIWYEMRKGKTVLKDRCRYLVRQPAEVFLEKGDKPPAEANEIGDHPSQEDLLRQPVYISHRLKKDPREIKVLDPACGSGHFLLYCFDLLQVIYEEAYDDPELGASLRKDYPALEDLRRAMPGLILKNNLHGIDIDLRATQIAALALWLRCQRAYQEFGLKNGARPKITRSNVVCAEPMPGEEDMRQEFVRTLDDKLGQLVNRIFNHMKLAGETGSLLQVEEEINTAIRETYGENGRIFQQIDEERWGIAEKKLFKALNEYAEQAKNGKGFRRHLFADDVDQGLAFVDISRMRYDVVLMNPPFGEALQRTLDSINGSFVDWNGNLLCAFISRALFLAPCGYIGVVYDRTANIKNTYENFRLRYFLSQKSSLLAVVDLGWEVLDANVEVSAGVIRVGSTMTPVLTWGCDLTKLEKTKKESYLRSAVTSAKGFAVKTVPTDALTSLPNSIIGYYFNDFMIRIFEHFLSLEKSGVKVFNGHTIKSDEYFRYWWEPECSGLAGEHPAWARLYNGGSYSRYYSPETDVVYYGQEGSLIENHPSTIFRNLKLQQMPGIAFGKRGDFIDAHILREGFVSTVEGQACSVDSLDLALIGLSILNSRIFQYGINTYCGQHKYPGYVNLFPIPPTSDSHIRIAAEHCRDLLKIKTCLSSYDETAPVFISTLDKYKDITEFLSHISQQSSLVTSLHQKINEECYSAYKLHADEIDEIQTFCKAEPKDRIWDDEPGQPQISVVIQRVISYQIGCIFGRWDIRIATGERQAPSLPDLLEPLPVCPPGMLQGPDGLPAKSEDVPSSYPVSICWDGILVDDPEHEDDIVRRVRAVLEVIWKDRAEAIEKETCEVLDVRDLRDYFRKPGIGGFWMDHIKRYSKSRRKAPIYWYLSSAKGNYGVWLYYHHLDKDILFKALLNYVEPKIRLEEDRLNILRGRKEAVGSSGREAKQIEKDIDHQEQFVSELHDFKDKLRRTADLHLCPDLNDGVILNIASLWELVPWNKAKECWDELLEGKYEWSNISKQLRGKELVSK